MNQVRSVNTAPIVPQILLSETIVVPKPDEGTLSLPGVLLPMSAA
jgi:hypothetical protein